MIINFNQENIEKLDGKGKVSKPVFLAGVLCFSMLLSGCNRTIFDTKYGFNKALIMGEI